jgi:LPXTG-motif cell wall-anchored protein
VAAAADDYVGTPPPTVLGETLQKPVVAAATQTRSAGLPVTGGDIAGLTFVGIGAIGLGTVLVRRRRVVTA